MTFFLSKALWILVAPGNLLLILLLLGVVLLLVGRPRVGMALSGLALAALTVIAVVPVGSWICRGLEDRFPIVDPLPARVDGIVVLGGMVDPQGFTERSMPAVNGRAERLMEVPYLMARYPEARVIFTGGVGSITHALPEVPAAQAALARMGVDPSRVIFEGQARNTWENGVFAKALAQPQPGEVWLLVTSALHMPRSVGVFRRLDWAVVPYPVDFETTEADGEGLGLSLTGGLVSLETGLHEVVGLVAYRLMDRTSAWFPEPQG